jgi:hypothetical protein
MIFLSAFVQMCLMIQMEFSYANLFQSNIYYWILGFKVMYFFIEVFIMSVVCIDKIEYAPMSAAIGCISNMTSMGASSFSQFLLSYMAGLFLTCLERLFVSPFINETLSLWPRWRLMLVRRFRLLNGVFQYLIARN